MNIEDIMLQDIRDIEREQRKKQDRAEAAHMLNKWREKHPYRPCDKATVVTWLVVAAFGLATIAVAVRAYVIHSDLNNARAEWAAERAKK